MSTLAPEQAAAIASGVYALRDQTVSEAVARHDVLGSEGMFNVADDSRFNGVSGGLYVCRVLSGFGYIAEGVGRHEKEILVATRGTAIKVDWLTNANVGLQRGPGGELVHAGFHQTWKSFSAEICRFLRGRNPTVIHCVGHSLGGALATLNADYFSSIHAGEVKLYTFGSPRVGSSMFARSLESRVGVQNMFRTFHCADPVPMIPLFPFFHVPTADCSYQLGNGSRGLFSFAAHSMEKSYVPGVGNDGWKALRARDVSNDHKMNAQRWLEQASAGSSGIMMGSTWALAMICKALSWLLEKACLIAFTGLSASLSAGLTALDYLALMLAKGAELSVEISTYLTTIIAAIFRFLGRTVAAGASLTLSFVRWVLNLLYQSLAIAASRALGMLR
ncbi:MAG TPA: lipase family protein [Rhodanobacter sp.]|nr:lipase family protein [Rhodanobacter sp.]